MIQLRNTKCSYNWKTVRWDDCTNERILTFLNNFFLHFALKPNFNQIFYKTHDDFPKLHFFQILVYCETWLVLCQEMKYIITFFNTSMNSTPAYHAKWKSILKKSWRRKDLLSFHLFLKIEYKITTV